MGAFMESRFTVSVSDFESGFGVAGIGTALTGGGTTWTRAGDAAA